ncbi:hypothetical protein EDD11_001300 [Mortierella claussenii]|nr:hypothetical protein EDD11_001300 [Mortierella claussenii]
MATNNTDIPPAIFNNNNNNNNNNNINNHNNNNNNNITNNNQNNNNNNNNNHNFGNNGNVIHAVPIDMNSRGNRLASTFVTQLPELVAMLLSYVDPDCLPRCSQVSKTWFDIIYHRKGTFEDFNKVPAARFSAKPLHINIHVLNMTVLQYPPVDSTPGYTEGVHQFIFSCQTKFDNTEIHGSGSSGNHSHRHHAHHLGQPLGTETSHHYRPSAIVPNIFFRTLKRNSDESSSLPTIPPVRSFSPTPPPSPPRPQHPEFTIDQILQHEYDADLSAQSSDSSQSHSDISLSPSQIDAASFPQSQAIYRTPSGVTYIRIPCPYETSSDGSVSGDDSPIPTGMDPRFGTRLGHVPGAIDIGGSSSGRSGEESLSMADNILLFSNEQRTLYDRAEYDAVESNDMDWSLNVVSGAQSSSVSRGSDIAISLMPYTTTTAGPSYSRLREDQHQHDHHDHRSFQHDQVTKSDKKSSRSKKPRPSRHWSLSFQTYLYLEAAINAMHLESKRYMQERRHEQCSVMESSRASLIIYNYSTNQELIWTITPASMDRTHPHGYVEPPYDASEDRVSAV